MRNVIQFSGAPGLCRIWRNLAEHSVSMVRIPADTVTRPGKRQMRQCLAVGVVGRQSVGGRGCGAADVPQGGGHQKRQAADRRVGREGNPERKREGDGQSHDDHSDYGRNKNEACDHFVQPPREVYEEDARSAWQQCGRALVKVRLEARFRGEFGSAMMRRSRHNQLRVAADFAIQSGRVATISRPGIKL